MTAILMGEYLVGAVVVLMLSGGTALEQYATRRASSVLNALAKTKQVPIYGINYKDTGDAALSWIAALGDPYTRIGADDGKVGIEWGVYGVPETFVVDADGRIRYKHVGPLSADDMKNKIMPLVAKLQK